MRVATCAMIVGSVFVTPAFAQTTAPSVSQVPLTSQAPTTSQAPSHAGHMMSAPNDADTPSTKAFKSVNDLMHKEMDIAYTGNADVDFVRGMIAHHQGAVDMARVVIAHGKDIQIQKFANEIIKAQEGEIAFMKKWLADQKVAEKSK